MARFLSHLGPNVGPSWDQNGVQIGPQTASNFITHSMLMFEPSWSVFKPCMSASWLSERAMFERPSNGFECLLDLQVSLIARRWSVSQEPLEPHLGSQNRSKIDPKIKQARDPQRIPVGIASGRLLDWILVDSGPNLGPMLGPSWPHFRPKEGDGVRSTSLLCCIRVKWPS